MLASSLSSFDLYENQLAALDPVRAIESRVELDRIQSTTADANLSAEISKTNHALASQIKLLQDGLAQEQSTRAAVDSLLESRIITHASLQGSNLFLSRPTGDLSVNLSSLGGGGGGGNVGNTTPTSLLIDQLSQTGSTLTAADGVTTYPARGILFGNRIPSMCKENTLFYQPQPSHLLGKLTATSMQPWLEASDACVNGIRDVAHAPHLVARMGGSFLMQHESLWLKLNAIHMHTTQATSPPVTFRLYGSRNRVEWKSLLTFEWNDTSAYHNGYTSTSHVINGQNVIIPARSAADLDGQFFVNATAQTSTANAPVCRRYVFDNTDYFAFYMLRCIHAPHHPNADSCYGIQMNLLEWEW